MRALYLKLAGQLVSKCIDQSRKRGWLLSAARVIEEESWERLAPILQHADEFPPVELGFDALVGHEGQTHSIE